MMPGPIRDEIAALELSGIGKVAVGAMHDPEVIPLWFGESDLVTPAFIREAAKRALDEGRTFYSYSRGTLALREAIQRYHGRIYGIDLHPDRITVPGSTMLTVAEARSRSQIASWDVREPVRLRHSSRQGRAPGTGVVDRPSCPFCGRLATAASVWPRGYMAAPWQGLRPDPIALGEGVRKEGSDCGARAQTVRRLDQVAGRGAMGGGCSSWPPCHRVH